MSDSLVFARRLVVVTVALVLLGAVPATASSGHLVAVAPLGGIVGSIFSSIGHTLLGAFSWTVGLASKFVLTTLAALVKLLIPHSWAHKGLEIMQWLVALPDYAGKITTPGGGQSYGFAGVNALRDLFMWLGVAAAPLSLVYATSRAMVGDGDPVAIPVLRMLAVAAVIASYPYWWTQGCAIADQVSNAILSVPDVARGINKLMDYAVTGVALGGWQLIDLGLMGAIGVALLGLIFLKVVLILLGALLYATGPLTIGLVPSRAGAALARAWASAVVTLAVLGVAWAAIFAVGAVLISDAGSAAPLVAGTSSVGSLVGGLLLAVAGLATLWLCLRAGREAGGLLRGQLSGLLGVALHHSPSSAPMPATLGARSSGSSIRAYSDRLARAGGGATQRLAEGGTAGAALAGVARSAAHVGRRGVLGAVWDRSRGDGPSPGSVPQKPFAPSRAGVVAARAAREGTAHSATTRTAAGQWRAGPRRPGHRTHGVGTPTRPGVAPAATSSTPTTRRARPTNPDAPGSPRPTAHDDGARDSQSPAADRHGPAHPASRDSDPPGREQASSPPANSTSTHGFAPGKASPGAQRRRSGSARPKAPGGDGSVTPTETPGEDTP